MNDDEKDKLRTGRLELLTENARLLGESVALKMDIKNAHEVLKFALYNNKLLEDNLTATQKRCTELIDDARDLRYLLAAKGIERAEIETWLNEQRLSRVKF